VLGVCDFGFFDGAGAGEGEDVWMWR
jgi:hypothetical protein